MDKSVMLERLLGLDDIKLSGFSRHARIAALDESAPRKPALLLLRRLARLKGGFDLPTIARIAVQFYPRNRKVVSEIVSNAVSQSTRQAGLLEEIVPALLAAAKDTPIRSLASIIAALSATSAVAARIGSSQELVCRLAQYYEASARSEPDRDFLLARLDFVQGVSTCLQAGFVAPLAALPVREDKIETLATLVSTVLEQPTSSTTAGPPQSLVNLSLLSDLEVICHLSDQLGQLPPVFAQDERLQYLRMTLASLAPSGQTSSGLELLTSSRAKGKGQALDTAPLTNGSLEAALEDVLSFLPDRDPAFIRRCLAHPAFAHAEPSKLISALLEDSLPIELTAPALDPNASSFVPGGRAPTVLSARANIFDAQPMDESRIRWTKSDRDKAADDERERREFLEATKAAIIARAEAPSSDEEDEDVQDDDAALRKLIKAEQAKSRGGLRDATLDELDADDGVLLPAPVLRAAESDNEESRAPTPQPRPAQSSGFSTAQQHALERAYVADSTIFDKTPAARNSAVRKALMVQTGLASDLIESWRVMLERDPRKDKLLAKHAFRGNERGAVDEASDLPSPSSNDDGGSRGRGRGRGGKRAAHDRRRRGHDRKMARGM